MKAAHALRIVCTLAALAGPLRTHAWAAEWKPSTYDDENTIELGVVQPDGSEHWFKVWVVVLDGQAYARLGSRSANYVAQNKTAPYLKVRVAGQQFDHVKGEPAPEAAQRVAAAMAAKYWSDIVIHLANHPVTLRLVE